MIIEKETPRMHIVIEPNRYTILIQQRWQYEWINDANTSPWTYLEKKDFHHNADELIWQQWGGQYRLIANGVSNFSKTHTGNDFILNFDIKWVLSNPHWDVRVTKTNNRYTVSSADWNNRVLNLDNHDTEIKNFASAGISGQTGITHEFGHAVGNTRHANFHSDEYIQTSPYFHDKASIMNLGKELRERHIDYILTQLNTMIPNTFFRFSSIR